MMNPSREYLKNLTKQERETIAGQVQTNGIYLYQISIGFRTPSKKLQLMLEKATKGKVKAQDFDNEVRECLAAASI